MVEDTDKKRLDVLKALLAWSTEKVPDVTLSSNYNPLLPVATVSNQQTPYKLVDILPSASVIDVKPIFPKTDPHGTNMPIEILYS